VAFVSSRRRTDSDLEVLERKRALRRFAALGTAAWTSFVLTDVLAAEIHGTSLAGLVALRLAGTGIGLFVILFTSLERVSSGALAAVEIAVAPVAALLVSLGALRCGGATSPLALGVATVALVRGVLPAPLPRALPGTAGSGLVFPVTILVASRLPGGEAVAAQLATPAGLWGFALTSTFLVLGGCVAAAGSHMLWSAKEQLHHARRLGSYRLVTRIGSGGMGDVWLARQKGLNRPVALKILRESTLRDPGALRRFRREAEVVSTLQHPNTIRVFDFGGSDDGVFYYAMELLDGLDLEEIIDRTGPMPPARAIHLARQICGSLAEAHDRGIVHCDLKPANLFVTKVGDDHDFAKVLDFGLVRVLAGDHTTVDTIRGTPAFMPPEVIRAEPVSPESDVYSMGAVLYWLVTGTPPFEGQGFHESVMAHLQRKPDRPTLRLGRELPADLEAVILRCLAKKKGERYASARELERALDGCAAAKAWSSADARASWDVLRPSLGTIPAMKVTT
jgi:serine/threonine-protein kinase